MFACRWAELDEPLGEDNVLFAEGSVHLAPAFDPPFPRDEEGLLFGGFGGTVTPSFGLWRGIEGEERARLAEQVRVIRHDGPDDFAVELIGSPAERRLVLAHFPATSLREAAAGVTERLRKGVGAIGRLRGKHHFRNDDVLRIPPLHLRLEGPASRSVRINLDGVGPSRPPPRELKLGRAEMYDRYFQLNEPFVLWAGQPSATELVAFFAAP